MASESGKLVSVAYPHDRFEHGVKGVEPLTRDGVRVPASKLKQIRQLAERHGVPIAEGDEVAEQQEPDTVPGAGVEGDG